MGVEVKQVIFWQTLKGNGEPDNPWRRIIEIWDMDGNKITEIDEWKEKCPIKTKRKENRSPRD